MSKSAAKAKAAREARAAWVELSRSGYALS